MKFFIILIITFTITLIWDKNKEEDMYKYNLYRSVDNGEFIYYDQIIHPDTIFIDNVDGGYYSYYLTAVDNSLNESLPSDTVGTLISSTNRSGRVYLSKVSIKTHPNPTVNFITYKITDTKRHKIHINIFDSLGKIVRQNGPFFTHAGTDKITINYSSLPNGTYFFKTEIGSGKFTLLR